jgi:hypothetical protein
MPARHCNTSEIRMPSSRRLSYLICNIVARPKQVIIDEMHAWTKLYTEPTSQSLKHPELTQCDRVNELICNIAATYFLEFEDNALHHNVLRLRTRNERTRTRCIFEVGQYNQACSKIPDPMNSTSKILLKVLMSSSFGVLILIPAL